MTLRMVVQAARGESVIALHGWLAGPEVAEFERVAGTLSPPLRIDLASLAGIDPCGIAALQAQRTLGARLANASPYISILLKTAGEAKTLSDAPRRGRRGSPTRG